MSDDVLELTGRSGPTEAHGGSLVDLSVDDDRRDQLRSDCSRWPSWELTERQICDLELLATGGFSPLRGFMDRDAWTTACERMRLPDGTIWPIPVTLEVTADVAHAVASGDRLALRDAEGTLLGAMRVEDVFRPDREVEAESVYGTTSAEHPGVAAIADRASLLCVGGELEVVELPTHFDFTAMRLTPRECRRRFRRLGWDRVVAFQTRNPMHRAHRELTLRAARDARAGLLLHPVVGLTKPGDVDHYTRVRCYRAILDTYPRSTAMLALLPLAMRMAGPREALWHAVIRRNHGCTHLIVGRDHAGPGANSDGTPFYDPYAAQDLLRAHEAEVGVEMVPFRKLTYVEELDEFLPDDEVPPGATTADVSGTELRRRLASGEEIPAWFTFPSVVAELRASCPPPHQAGVTVLFTGLSGSGKSTIAKAVTARLLELGNRRVSLLDGDLVRKNLSSELGFSREHRDVNVRRIGFVAAEIAKHGGIALCAPIAPYDAVRREVRAMTEAVGRFVLVHVSTPLEVCERRDRKGLYASARAGRLPAFTGISDPYEVPTDAELVLDASVLSVAEAADAVLGHLVRGGHLPPG